MEPGTTLPHWPNRSRRSRTRSTSRWPEPHAFIRERSYAPRRRCKYVAKVTVRGGPFVLEVGAGANAKGVAEAFESAGAAAQAWGAASSIRTAPVSRSLPWM